MYKNKKEVQLARMIKILQHPLLTFIIIILITANASNASATNWDRKSNLDKVNAIGNKILNANKLPTNIKFKVSNSDSVNAHANINKEIYVYRGLLENVETTEELAGVIAHEIGHIVNRHSIKQTFANVLMSSICQASNTIAVVVPVSVIQVFSSKKISRSDEFEADLTAVDLLVTSGYNPLCLISVLNKMCGNYIDILNTHPSGEKRLLNIYDYIAYNYPTFLEEGYSTTSYKRAQEMILVTLKEREESEKKLAKAQKHHEKLKKERLKRAKKMRNKINPWDASYTMLKLIN